MALVLDGNGSMTFGNGTVTGLNAGAISTSYISGGIIKQIVTVVKSDTMASTPGGVWADIPGLSVSITPTNSSSKILVLADVKGAGYTGGSVIRSRMLRNGSPVYIGDTASNRALGMGQWYIGDAADHRFYIGQLGGTFIDSPNTTSSLTYKMQFGMDGDAWVGYINRTMGDRDGAYNDARVASSITLIEIL